MDSIAHRRHDISDKTWKKLDDVSKYLMIFVAGGAFLWTIYGIEKDDPYIIGVNVAAIVLTMIVLTMKLRYEKYKTS